MSRKCLALSVESTAKNPQTLPTELSGDCPGPQIYNKQRTVSQQEASAAPAGGLGRQARDLGFHV